MLSPQDPWRPGGLNEGTLSAGPKELTAMTESPLSAVPAAPTADLHGIRLKVNEGTLSAGPNGTHGNDRVTVIRSPGGTHGGALTEYD